MPVVNDWHRTVGLSHTGMGVRHNRTRGWLTICDAEADPSDLSREEEKYSQVYLQ